MVRVVLTADVRFEGWTAEDWWRFVTLWKPRASPEREPTRPRGALLVIHDGTRIRKMLHTGKGRIDPRHVPEATGAWPVPLGELAETHHASWALAAHVGALDEVMERFGARARRHDDLTAQALSLVGIVRDMLAEGKVDSWPRRLRRGSAASDVGKQRTIESRSGGSP
jgi:hypothetical protein